MLTTLHLLIPMTINERVQLLIDKVSGSKASFSSTTGISTVIISHISSGRNKVSLNAVEQILEAYPNVNAEWLILGKGGMFKEQKDTRQLDLINSKLGELKLGLQSSIESADRKIESITKLIENLEL